MVKVLVTGATGLLGRSTFSAFKNNKSHKFEVYGTSFTRKGEGLINIDLRDQSALSNLIATLQPSIVIHCAAERRPDVCEQKPEEVETLNVQLPAQLSQLSRSTSHPFFLIYISTDYVFAGDTTPERGYQPYDITGPSNLYGRTKLAGENAVLDGIKLGGKGCSLRVPVLYGPVESNSESAINCLLDVVLSTKESGKVVKMDNWAIRYPTNVLDVARVLVDISIKSLEPSKEIPKILHFSTQHKMTKVDVCQLLAKLSGIELTKENFVSIDDGPKLHLGETNRPRDCHLSNDAIEALGISTAGINFETWWREWLAKSSS